MRTTTVLLLEFVALASPLVRAGGEPLCEDFAHAFYLIAQNKDRGVSKEAQIQHLLDVAGVGSPSELGGGDRFTLRAIEFVYRYPDSNAETIRGLILGRCHVDANGKLHVEDL